MIFRYTLWYALLFTALAIVNRYPEWLSLPPASIHQWRQADGESMVWQYRLDPAIGQPRIPNRFYTNDPHTVGELPLLYWLASRFGWPDYPLRWIGLLIMICAGWALGWMALQRCRKPMESALFAMLLLGSPIWGYYGPGFLPDAPALGFMAIAMAFFFRKTTAAMWCGTLLTALTVLLKISLLILPVALALVFIREKKYWPSFVAVVLLTAAGRYWMWQYKAEHQAFYFLAGARPIWKYDIPFILETCKMAVRNILPVFISVGAYLGVLLAAGFRRQWTGRWNAVWWWTTLGSAAYFLLWFRMFREHDYYALCLIVWVAITLLASLPAALEKYPPALGRAVLTGLVLLGMAHSHFVLQKRLHTTGILPVSAFMEEHGLDSLKVPREARFLCPEDPSPNTALLALKRTGWTAYNFGDRITADTLQKYQTRFGLRHLALRDSSVFNGQYRRFFPVFLGEKQGWFLYAKRE